MAKKCPLFEYDNKSEIKVKTKELEKNILLQTNLTENRASFDFSVYRDMIAKSLEAKKNLNTYGPSYYNTAYM